MSIKIKFKNSGKIEFSSLPILKSDFCMALSNIFEKKETLSNEICL